MARARSIKRRKKKKTGLPFLPDFMQAFLARRFVDIFAFTLGASGLFLFTALASYSHKDPSWNTASAESARPISNWGGTPGAWISDLLLQTIGVGAFAFAAALVIWGLRTYRRESLSPLWLRGIALPASAFFTAVAFAQISAGDWLTHPYLGSTFGTMTLDTIGPWVDRFLPVPGYLAVTILGAILAVSSFIYAAAVTRQELAIALTTTRNIITIAALFVFDLFMAFKNWVAHYNDEDYRPEPLKLFNFKPRTALRREPLISAPQPPPSRAEPQMPVAARPQAAPSIPVVAKPAQTKPQGPTQQRFSLSEENWDLPPLNLLQDAPSEDDQPEHLNEEALRKNAQLLQNVLADFNVEGEIVSIHPGPVVTLYELEPAPGVKTSRVIGLADDIARSMSAVSVRIAVVPGRSVIGIELPNKQRQTVFMQELLASNLYEKTQAKLPLILGKDIGGQPILADLAKMPHLLVAGTTGSGKSVAVNTMILSLLFCLPPEKCRFIMIDPKMLELSVYDDIPHLLAPVVTEPGKAVVSLKWTVNEMEERYRTMSKLGVRNIEGYNAKLRDARKKGESITRKVQTGFNPSTGEATYEDQEMDLTELPYIVVVVDEFADLMLVAGKDVEAAIQRLAQMARAAGIHLIMATQRPSVDVITGVIKANFPTRISFQVTSKVDSRTILGEGGAEQLLGMGDMLYMAPGGRITRVHGPFVSDKDVKHVTDFLREQGEPSYIESITDGDGFGGSEIMGALFGDEGGDEKVDDLYDQAVALVAREGKASTSFVQRYLQIGYNRAARIVEEMERQGIISPANAVGKREVLVRDFSDV